MKALILAGGYAKRLWPLTKNTPKPLLEVGGKKILDYILDKIEANQAILLISVISLMEIMYLSEKNRINITLNETLQKIKLATNYIIVDLTPEILQIAETVVFNELHDRLILSTAKFLDISIISSDKNFKNLNEISVIWD